MLWTSICLVTGDNSILEEQVPFLEGAVLEESEMERYDTPRISGHQAPLYNHCIIALDRAVELIGPHGLPLIGGGDWNDGFNMVGKEGKGESVWLAWFLAHILNRFAYIVEGKKDQYRADEYRSKMRSIVEAVENFAWDGEWYRRAYFDNGQPLGSAQSPECRIDSLAQSWGIISGFAAKDRREMAFERALEHLVSREHMLIRLLWPPFERSTPSPGYIQGYLAGLRENGGQYTHAAAWLVMAAALLGRGDAAFELFDIINPINHCASPDGVKRYRAEPYVTCGDVYSVEPYAGRGGWSWYTGSSGWLYRVALENILGFKLRGEYLELDPCIPKNWREFLLIYRRKGTTLNIMVINPAGVNRGVKEIKIEGRTLAGAKIKFAKLAAYHPKTELQVLVELGGCGA